MEKRTKLVAAVAGASLAAVGVLAATGAAGPSTSLANVAAPNAKASGMSAPNILSPELQQVLWAHGSMKVENPSNGVSTYGYDDGSTFLPLPANTTPGSVSPVQLSVTPVEAQKTEPDKNTYLVLDKQTGADPNYDYGRHFLFQGHETGSPGYITRINLDADGAHRVTLLATKDSSNANLPNFDGSTWDPWAKRLLMTAENGNKGGVWQATLDVPSTVDNLSNVLGKGGYEGIQNDDRGNVYIVEDSGGNAGGSTSPNTKASKRPNSYIYRFLPKDPGDLTKGGTFQALQILRKNGDPMTYGDPSSAAGVAPDSTILSQDMKDIHTYGTSFATKWIPLDQKDALWPDVNALARKSGATPLKRPENGVFQPGSKFKDFYFTETGDTNADSAANAVYGGWGGLFHLTQDPKSNDGSITIFFNGDSAHTGLDNIQFFGGNQLAAVEDAGDTLHTQRNALDSAYMLDTKADYSKATNAPVRFIAEGRDASATTDSALGSLKWPSGVFTNEGDNEITGIHVSDGDPGKNGVLGTKKPKPFGKDGNWRAFWTQQHGDNNTWELIPSNADRSAGYDNGDS